MEERRMSVKMRKRLMQRKIMMRVSACLVAATLIAGVLTLTATAIAEPDTKEWSEANWYVTSHEVQKGETFWELTADFCPDDIDVEEYRRRVNQLNNGYTSLQYGTYILLYVEN